MQTFSAGAGAASAAGAAASAAAVADAVAAAAAAVAVAAAAAATAAAAAAWLFDRIFLPVVKVTILLLNRMCTVLFEVCMDDVEATSS